MIEIVDGAGEIPFGAPGVAAVVVGGRQAGIEAQRQIVVGDGAVRVALLEPDDAAIVERGGVLRVELDRLVVVGNRLVEVALAPERQPAIEIRGGVSGGQPDRLVVVGDGAVELAFAVERIAPRHEHAGVGCVELDRRVEVGDGAVEIALGEPHAAAVGIGAGVRRVEADRLGEVIESARGVALGAHRQSAVVVQDGEIGSLVAARFDQHRARGNPLVGGGAPLPGATPLVRALGVCGRGECQRQGQRQRGPSGQSAGRRFVWHYGLPGKWGRQSGGAHSRFALIRLQPMYSSVYWRAKPCGAIYAHGRRRARNRRQPKRAIELDERRAGRRPHPREFLFPTGFSRPRGKPAIRAGASGVGECSRTIRARA